VVAQPCTALLHGAFRVAGVTMQHRQLDGGHGLSGNATQPVSGQHETGQQFGVGVAQLRVLWQRLDDGVTGELTVPFPLNCVVAVAQAQKILTQVVESEVLVARQLLQVSQFVGTGDAFVQHRHVDHQRG